MDALQKIIEKNPSYRLLGKVKLQKATGLPKAVIDEWYNQREIAQIYAKPRKVSQYKINAPPRSFQIDIVVLPQYRKTNNGVKEFLMLIDILSRKMLAYPLKDGRIESVVEKYKSFIGSIDSVNSVEGDDFFNNKTFKDLNDKHGIRIYTDVAKDDHLTSHGNKLGIIDRATRTIKNYIQKYMLVHDTTKWVEALPELVDLYNTTTHSSLDDRTPNQAYDDKEYQIRSYTRNDFTNHDIQKGIDLNVGDRVRAMIGKGVFDKEKAPFSKEIYTIVDLDGRRYVLADEQGKKVKRKYRPSELLKVDKVTERIGETKGKADKEHKHTTKVRKATGKSYEAATEAIQASNAPRPNRVRKVRERLDL